MKKILLLSTILFACISMAKAQVSAGVNLQSSDTFVTIGTNPNSEFFGEARVSTGRSIGLELMGGYNLVQKDDVNFYLGLGLGIEEEGSRDDFYFGVPFGLLVKPFSASRNLGIVLEAAPIFPNETGSYFRGGFGFKYTFN